MTLALRLSKHIRTLADNALILGHRNSEWCGHAPILEEDIAFANLALDEIGHAQVFYRLYAELLGEDIETYPDMMVYHRPLAEWRNASLFERPKGDWAFTVLRQFLYDSVETIRLNKLAQSNYQPLADATKKLALEKIYHLRHSREWVKRLGLGTDVSNEKMQTALNELSPYFQQYLTAHIAEENELAEAGYIISMDYIKQEWENAYSRFWSDVNLTMPESSPISENHSEHLVALLDELQEVHREYPDSKW
jgi:ring-1,2-phenylacetyl-CoA epoxidase subunit PaaC